MTLDELRTLALRVVETRADVEAADGMRHEIVAKLRAAGGYVTTSEETHARAFQLRDDDTIDLTVVEAGNAHRTHPEVGDRVLALFNAESAARWKHIGPRVQLTHALVHDGELQADLLLLLLPKVGA